MIALDVNVLVFAFDEDAVDHDRYRAWLEASLVGAEPMAVPDIVLSGFVWIATHPRVLVRPGPMDVALAFADAIRSAPAVIPLAVSDRHWSTFDGLCRTAGVKGDLVPDAFLAALAIDTGATFVTTDRDFSRFPGLQWRHPLDGAT